MKTTSILLAGLVSVLGVNTAAARDWLVERVSGTAWAVAADKSRTKIQTNMKVPEGLTIQTEASGRVRLTSENNVMTLAPNSLVSVVPKGFFSSKTQVLEKYGSVEFDIEKRAQPHFAVDTPYMAAVVKGTKFTINVSKTDTKIGVARGLVQVSDHRTGQTAGIGVGQRASVSKTGTGLKTGGAVAPAVSAGPPTAPAVAPVGQTLQAFAAQMAASAPAAATTTATTATMASSAALSGTAQDTKSSASSQSAGTNGPGNSGKGSDGKGPDGKGPGGGPGNGGPGNNGGPGKGNGGPGKDGPGKGGDGPGNGGPGPGHGGPGNGNGNSGPGKGGPGNGKGNNGNGNGNGGPGGGKGKP